MGAFRRPFMRPWVFVVVVSTVVLGTTVLMGNRLTTGSGKLDVTTFQPLPPPPMSGGSVVMIDVASGQLLLTERAHRAVPPGGLTKLVTAAVILYELQQAEASLKIQGTEGPPAFPWRTFAWREPDDAFWEKMNEAVTISRFAAHAPGYNLGMETGETVPLKTLFQGMFFLPGVDATVALAEHVATSTYAFTAHMDRYMHAMGMTGSRFQTPHGLDVPDQYATAFELAVVARHVMTHPWVRQWIDGRHGQFDVGLRRGRVSRNMQSFLWRYSGTIGAVSSYTPASGYSMAAMAKRGGRTLLIVVTGASSADERHAWASALLDYGFAHYSTLLETPLIDRAPYRVQSGDTLSRIAHRMGVPLYALQYVNGMDEGDFLRVGETVWIPF